MGPLRFHTILSFRFIHFNLYDFFLFVVLVGLGIVCAHTLERVEAVFYGEEAISRLSNIG